MMSQAEVAVKTGVMCESLEDQHTNEKGSATELHAARELALEEIIALCKDYAEDSQPDSEYRLACNDIIEAIQERRALSSPDHADAGKVEGDGWLPIESAPRDGQFLAWSPRNCGCQMVWNAERFAKANEKHMPEHLRAEHWTHWRPLPASPGASE